jgi:sugar lactone lactonase YvrE
MYRRHAVSILAALAMVAAGLTAHTLAQRRGFSENMQTAFTQGLLGPESVLYDAEADVYLISNVNGGPGDKDDNGFIVRLAPDLQNYELRWIDGAAGDVTLHAPKGMAFRGNLLLVADIDTVRLFDRKTGKPAGAWPVSGAAFLNDIAVSGNTIYVSDTGISFAGGQAKPQGTAAIYRFESDAKQPTAIAKGDALGGPNGIITTPEGVVFVTFLGDKIMRLKGNASTPETVATLPAGQLDGLARLGDGSYVVSSWAASGIFRVRPDGQSNQIRGGLSSPAGLEVDEKRRRVIVPQLMENRVHFVPID